jgi:hypothetical protein
MATPRRLTASPWLLGVGLFAALYWLVALGLLRTGVPHPLDDCWEDGIVARLLMQGHGFRTHMIFPALWSLRDPQTLTLPVLVHGPLLPLILVLPLALFGPPALDQVAWIAAAFATLTLIPLFRFAARRFGEPAAAAAAVLFTLSPLTLAAVDHYLTVVVGALALALVVDLLARERPRPALAGLTAGLGYLARPEMLVAAPVLAFLAAGARRRAAWIFLLGFAVAAAPWWWERWRSAGSPLFNLSSYLLLCFSPSHPGDALVRDFTATPDRFGALFAAALPGLWHKWIHFFPRAVAHALTTPSPGTGALAVVGAAMVLARPATRRLGGALALIALMPVAMITVLASVRLYPVPFLPLYCVAAALGAYGLVERLPGRWRRPRAVLPALVLLLLPSVVAEFRGQIRDARAAAAWMARDRPALAAVASRPENDHRPMFSDTPDFVAWTTGRPTLWLTLDELRRLYAPGADLPPGLPRRPHPADTWFHHGNLNDPAGKAGFRVEVAAPPPSDPAR